MNRREFFRRSLGGFAVAVGLPFVVPGTIRWQRTYHDHLAPGLREAAEARIRKFGELVSRRPHHVGAMDGVAASDYEVLRRLSIDLVNEHMRLLNVHFSEHREALQIE